MAKKLLATGYRIDINENAVYLQHNVLHQRLLLITDVTLNRIIYNFADSASGLVSIEYDELEDETKIVFVQSLSLLEVSEDDTLQVLVENEAVEIRPEDPFLDPVSKLRVSNPENLIDTDFEYGLQSSKWETIKLVNNVPSFYSKATAQQFDIVSVQATEFSNSVIVKANEHGLTLGTPFELSGLTDSQYEGGYIVSSVPDINTFTFDIPFSSISSQELSTVYTNILTGAFYFGSQISVLDIVTDGLPNSTIKVQTRFLHGFSLDTPFYFLNSVAVFRQDIPYDNIVFNDTIINEKESSFDAGGENDADWRNKAITPYEFIPLIDTQYFDEAARGGPGRHDNKVHDWFYARMSPVQSVVVNNGGAGYNYPPHVYAQGGVWGQDRRTGGTGFWPGHYTNNQIGTYERGTNHQLRLYPSSRTDNLANAVWFSSNSFVGLEWNGEPGEPQSNNWYGQRGIEVELHRFDNQNPFSWQTGDPTIVPWEDCITATDRSTVGYTNDVTDPNADGYSPIAVGSNCTLEGAFGGSIAANDPTATLTVNEANLQGQMVVGQEISVFETSNNSNLLRRGFFIKEIGDANVDGNIEVTIQMPPVHNGYSGSISCYFLSQMWDTIDSTFYVKNHGLKDGDAVYMWSDWTVGSGDYWRARAENTNTVDIDNNAAEQRRTFYAVRVDENKFRLAKYRMAAMQGRSIDLYEIGRPNVISGVAQLPRYMFLKAKPLWMRGRTYNDRRHGYLYPTFEDAVNKTNNITFDGFWDQGTAYTSAYWWITTRSAYLEATIQNQQVTEINVTESGDHYYQHQEWSAYPYIAPRRITKGLAYTHLSGTNTLTLKSGNESYPLIVGMRVENHPGDSGIPANCVITGIESPDENGFYRVTLSGNLTANMPLGDMVHFLDNVSTNAQAQTLLLGGSLYVPDHGLKFGDYIKFEHPPGANDGGFTQSTHGWRDWTTYYAIPISKDRFSLGKDSNSLDPNNIGRFTVRDNTIKPSYNTDHFTTRNGYRYAFSKVIRIESASGTEYRFNSRIDRAPWNLSVGDVVLQTSDWNGDSYWTGMSSSRRTNRQDSWYDSRYYYPLYIKSISADGRGVELSTSPTGSSLSVGSQTSGRVFLKPVSLIPEANSIYIPNHGFETDDYVIYTTDGVEISGLNAENGQNGYLIDKVSDSRFKLKNRANSVIIDIKNDGDGLHEFRNEKYDPFGNTIFKEDHGFAPSDRITYDPNNNPIIDGLISNDEYTLRKVSDDRFRLSDATTAQELEIVRVTKPANATRIEFEFAKNHGYAVGDTFIVRDNEFPELNTFWTVAEIDTRAASQFANQSAGVYCNLTPFQNPARAYDQKQTAGQTYGVAYEYINFEPVRSTNTIIEPAQAGDLFTTIKAFDSQISNKTPRNEGGGLINEQIAVESDIIPFGSKIEQTSGTNIVTARVRFPQADISTITRESNVVTVVTSEEHGYDDQQTVVISGVDTESFNTEDPVVITVVDSTSFTFAQTDSDEEDTAGNGAVTMALTQEQADKFAPNNVNWTYSYLDSRNNYDTFREPNDFSVATHAQYQKKALTNDDFPSRANAVAADAGADKIWFTAKWDQIPNITKTSSAPIYRGQFVVPLTDVEGLAPGMYVWGADFDYDQTFIESVDVENSRIFVTKPLTGNGPSGVAVNFKPITIGQEVRDNPQFTQVTGVASAAGENEIETLSHNVKIAANLYPYATTALTATEGDADVDTNTFTLSTLSNVFNFNRISQESWQSTNPYISSASYQSGSTDWANVRSFNSVQNVDPADDDIKPGDDTITIPDHPWETGDAVRYNSNGGVAPSGLTSGNVYYVIVVDGDNIKLASSEENANADPAVAIDILDVGSGNGHYLFGNVYFGASVTSNTGTYYTGTISVGMGLSCITTNATGVIPVGARVAEVRDLGTGVSQSFYRHVVKISTIDDSLVTGIMGGVDANGNETRMQLRAGVYSNGTTFYTDDVTGLAAGMVPAEWHNGDGTIANGTIITAVDAVNNTFTVNIAPDTAIRGTRMICGTGVADTSQNTRIYTDNLTGLEVGMVIAQRSGRTANADANNITHINNGRPFRGLMYSPRTTMSDPYYVTNIDLAGGFFDINKAPGNDGGTNFLGDLLAGSWSADNDLTYLWVSNSVGSQLAPNHTLNLLGAESDEQGALAAGYTFIRSGNSIVTNGGGQPYRLYLNQDPSTKIRGMGVGFGARSINTEIYLPDASGINTGMVLTLTGGTGALQGTVTVSAVDPDNPMTTSNNGLGGDYISVVTDDPSGDPFATDLIDAGIDFELANAITVGQYVFSSVRSFPNDATVTAVDTNTKEITISQTHGGIPEGSLIEFSPFSSTTYVTIPSTSSDNTIELSEPHGGIQGGVSVSYRKLPRGTRVSKMLDVYSTSQWWLIELAPPQPFAVPVSSTTTNTANGGRMNVPMEFIGENLNLASSHGFDSFGTHIFTRSTNADGVYQVIDVQPTEFTVGSTSFIPKNTKTFSNLDVDIVNNWFKINNHKFRDGTALIYDAGGQDPIGIDYPFETTEEEVIDPETGEIGFEETPVIDDEVGSPTEGLPLPQIDPETGERYVAFLEDGKTYYSVLIDPSYFYLTDTFDEARSDNPRIITLRTNTNGAQAFDTFSLQGFTKGEGLLSLSDSTSIVGGFGTKFQTNFKGGDVLRFYTQGNPGKIFKYVIQAVKSDESMKLTEEIEPDRSLIIDLNNPVTLNAGDQIQQTIGENVAVGYVEYDYVAATEIELYDVGGEPFEIGTNIVKVNDDDTTTSLNSSPTTIVNPFNFTAFERNSYNVNQAIATQGDQTIRMSTDSQGITVEDIKPGYIVSDVLSQYFEEKTRVLSVDENTGFITIDKKLKTTLPRNTSISFQPTFEYFIETNLYVKSNAITSHKPFDGGVSMTTGLNPDSVISRQTRKYFRYQSGKGIQCSMAINFNPPTDCELLTSNENVASIRVDRPHGFKPGGENRIRVTEAEVTSGHNGYNGTFYVEDVLDDYNFTYVYEDTPTIGKITSGSTVINNVAKFNDVEIGKLIKSGTFNGITVDLNTVVEDFDEIQRTITLSKPLVGNSGTQSWESISRVNNILTVFTQGIREVPEDRVSLQFTGEIVTFEIGSVVTQTQVDSTVASGVIVEKSEDTVTLNQISGDGTFSTGLPITVDGVLLNNYVPDDVDISTINVDQQFGSEHDLEVGQWISLANSTDSNLDFVAGEIISVNPDSFQVYSVGLDGDEDYTGSAEITVLNTLSQYRQNGSSTAFGFPKYNLKEWKDASIRAGLFDSQNGMFFEFDGKNLNCCRRSSVQQLSGKAIATYRSSLLRGVDTRFSTQLAPGDAIVIRGMTYKVIGIESDTALHIQPEYRGQSLTDIIVTKVVDVKIPQYDWNLDIADGTGRSGYVLDINKIQMVYIDYSWYGAGKIRFGFKNQIGEVVYFHEFVHNNKLVEAYMRSGNIPARYEVETYKEPTFSPALFHWGTSVIMDGRFDSDESYLFTADSNIITLTNGGKLEVSVPTSNTYREFRLIRGNNFIWININDVSALSKGAVIQVKNDRNGYYIPRNTTIEGVDLSQTLKVSTITCVKVFISNTVRNSIWSGYTTTTYEIGGGATAVSIDAQLSPIPLVSIRLSPSVDNGLSGGLGFRDVINRMQLTLNSCGVLLTHESEVKLYLNADLSDSDFLNNDSPSLSQIHIHKPGETFLNGIQLFSFRANGGQKDPQTGKRTLSETSQELGDLVTLGNSILGGDEVFPNGPDILTIAVKPIDTSTISGNEPFQGSARITWSESQA